MLAVLGLSPVLVPSSPVYAGAAAKISEAREAMAESKYGPHVPDKTYIPHAHNEQLFDTGEVMLNYAMAGSSHHPALVLIPGQTESWWGYEPAMELLKENFEVYALDLRGQGRSSRTSCRYTLDNFGEDVARFIAFRIRRPVIVSGLSSGGLIAAWLSAYAPPGILRGDHYEDPPLFSAELAPERGPGVRQTGAYDMLALQNKYLGDQWTVGDEEGLAKAMEEAAKAMPPQQAQALAKALPPSDPRARQQMMKEYDPEWARAFVSGTVGASCDHARMLAAVKCPVLFTHHFRWLDEKTGTLIGAISDRQVALARELITDAGQAFVYRSFPEIGHPMHVLDPALFSRTLTEWAATLPSESEVRKQGVFDGSA
jgi:pimeloyl-ACP methyl ester carboxylesterase